MNRFLLQESLWFVQSKLIPSPCPLQRWLVLLVTITSVNPDDKNKSHLRLPLPTPPFTHDEWKEKKKSIRTSIMLAKRSENSGTESVSLRISLPCLSLTGFFIWLAEPFKIFEGLQRPSTARLSAEKKKKCLIKDNMLKRIFDTVQTLNFIHTFQLHFIVWSGM